MDNSYWSERGGSRKLPRRAVLRGGLMAAAGLGAAALIGCGGSKEAAKPAATTGAAAASASPAAKTVKRGGELHTGSTTFNTTLDPVYSTSYGVPRMIFDTLLGSDDKGIPGIAPYALTEKYEQVNETTLVLTLRKGVKFTDGTDFTSEAAKFAYDRTVAATPAGQVWKGLFPSVDKVEMPDPNTVKYTFKTPDAPFLATLAEPSGAIMSPTHYRGKDQQALKYTPVGTGPYKYAAHNDNAWIRLEPNEGHWRKAADGGRVAMVDKFQIDTITDPTVLGATIESGKIHHADVQPQDQTAMSYLEQGGKLNIVKSDGYSVLSMWVQHDLAPMNNEKFRQGIAAAMDRAALVKSVYQGLFTPANSILSPISWAHVDSKLPAFDVAAAKALIDGSGVPEAQRTILVTTSEPQAAYEFVQASLAKIGVKTTFVPFQEARTRYEKNAGHKGDIHMNIGGLTHKADPHHQLATQFLKTSLYNMGAASTGEIEPLVAKAAATYKVEERKALYKQIQEIHGKTLVAFIPLAFRPLKQYSQKNVTGVAFNPIAGRTWYNDLGFSS